MLACRKKRTVVRTIFEKYSLRCTHHIRRINPLEVEVGVSASAVGKRTSHFGSVTHAICFTGLRHSCATHVYLMYVLVYAAP